MTQERLRAHFRAIAEDETDTALSVFFRASNGWLTWRARQLARWARSPYDEANDIVQEVLIRIYRHARQFERSANPAGYLARTIQNVALSRWKRHCGHREESLYEAEVCAGQDAGDAAGDVDLRRAINELPHMQREVLLAVDEGGFSHEETARLLGLRSAGASRALRHRAVKSLRKALQRDTSRE